MLHLFYTISFLMIMEMVPECHSRKGDYVKNVAKKQRRQINVPQINIHVTAPLFTARLYDHGTEEGDEEVPKAIDVGMRFELKHPLMFYGQKYSHIFILSNGGVGFEQDSRNYKQNILRESSTPLILTLWNRNDLRKGGQIFFREITTGRSMERGQSEVRYQYNIDVKPVSMVIISWIRMQPFGDQQLDADNTNSVQVAFINTENETYANIIYKNIGWSLNAEAGFTRGTENGQNFLALPWSATNNVILLKENGNTGIPGEWIFKIDGQKIISCPLGKKGDTCDEECRQNEWGFDCANCCHCQSGKCDTATGACDNNQCKACWINAPICNKRDPSCSTGVKECGTNAVAFTNREHCGEAVLRCQCLTGFTGDGYNCTDIDECLKKDICGPYADCLNTQGGYLCQCTKGYINPPGNRSLCVPEVSTGLSSNRTIIVNNSTEKFDELLTIRTTSEHTTLDVKNFTTPLPVVTVSSNVKLLSTSDHSSHSMETTTTAQNLAPLEIKAIVKTVLPKFLPKETNSHLIYNLTFPIKIFGKIRDVITVWSTGVVAMGKMEPINFDKDLVKANVKGFVPFFDKIDLGRDEGNVIIGETADPEILSDATAMVRQHFQSQGFLATSVLTVTYENVTSPNGQVTNTFEVVLISGYNALGENVTFVEYVYNRINWFYSAKAFILHEDIAYTFEFPGSGTEAVKQLEKFSNIQLAGEWMYRVDSMQSLDLCPLPAKIPPFCELEKELPTSPLTASTSTSKATAPTTAINTTRAFQSTPFKYSHPLIDFEGNGETITFPSFITLVPQLVTGVGIRPQISIPIQPQILTSGGIATQSIIRPITTTPQTQPQTVPKIYYNSTLASSGLSSTLITTVNERNVSITFPTPVKFTLHETTGTIDRHPALITAGNISTAETTTLVPVLQNFGTIINSSATSNISKSLVTLTNSTDLVENSINLPPLQIFTLATTKRSTRPPVPIKVPTTKPVSGQKNKDLDNDDSLAGDQSRKAGGRINDDDDGLNSAGKLAIIIPTAIVGVWLLLLVLIGVVVCCRRRGPRKRSRNKYDPSAAYFRSITGSGHPAATVLQQSGGDPGVGGKDRSSSTTNGYSFHESHEDGHVDKNGHVTEMCHHGCQASRSGAHNSYWDGANSSRQPQQQQQPYGYYNQGYYDSCPDVNNRHAFNGRY